MSAGFIIIAAVAAFYIPLPFSSYPADLESRRIAFQLNTLASLGLSPWLLAIVIWQIFDYGFKQTSTGPPITNVFATRVLLTTLVIAAFNSWQFVQNSQYWVESSVEQKSILLPAVSLIACCFVFVFLARLLDTAAKGWGLWILICGISLSGICFSIGDIVEAHKQTALFYFDILRALAWTLAGFAVAVFAVSAARHNLREKGLSLVLATLVVETSQSWIFKMIELFMMAQPDRAIFFDTYRSFFQWSIILFIGLSVTLIWLSYWTRASNIEKLVPIMGVVGINLISTGLARTLHFPLLATTEIMSLACGAVALYHFLHGNDQNKSLEFAMKIKSSRY